MYLKMAVKTITRRDVFITEIPLYSLSDKPVKLYVS